MSYDLKWDALSPSEFEEFVLWLVTALGYEDPRRVSGSGDEGEDVVAYFRPQLKIPVTKRKWVFQCKHVRRITKREIEGELANFASGNLDTWVLVTTAQPSTQLRRWLDQLRSSKRYPFHLEAWWRDDLERVTREADESLRRVLPSRLSHLVGLPSTNRHTESVDLAAFSARCREHVNAQIERYAHGKYIPGLYVQRKVQADVARFLEGEAAVAQAARAELVASASAVRSRVEKALDGFRTAFRRIPRAENDDEESVRQRHLVHFRDDVISASQEWIATFQYTVAQLAAAAGELSMEVYFTESGKYAAIERIAQTALDHLHAVPLFPQPLEIATSSERQGPALPRVGVLSYGHAIPELKEALGNVISQARSPFKPALLILDRAGSGKTNLVCHTVTRLAETQPVLLMFGRQPTLGPDFLIDEVISRVAEYLRIPPPGTMETLDDLLAPGGQFLSIFIDGINENRDLRGFDVALGRLITWSARHRIRVILTCRDIYWNFFNQDEWAVGIRKVHHDEIRDFTPREYESALPLYLAHYNIHCSLTEQAEKACQHPLLLRFFCEAYGSRSTVVNLGEVRDIRLKELFQEYIHRKADQIRKQLGEQNSARVIRYLLEVASLMFRRTASSIDTSAIANATGDPDVSGENSLYLHLLDEEIILEEQPGGLPEQRRMAFVYEEFMEYLVGRAIMSTPAEFGLTSAGESFTLLDALKDSWTNTRGIGEYVCLLLFDQNEDTAGEYLREFASSNSTIWRDAYWSVLGKLPQSRFQPQVLDTVPVALSTLSDQRLIGQMLTGVSRYGNEFTEYIATALIWSAMFPSVITWSTFAALPHMDGEQTMMLAVHLSNQYYRIEPAVKYSKKTIIEAASQFLSPVKRAEIRRLQDAMKPSGISRDEAVLTPAHTVEVLARAFPDFAPLLVNGLFTRNEDLETACAREIGRSTSCRSQLAILARVLADRLRGTEVGALLRKSSEHLSG